jgi:hypothetical protein
MEEDGMTITIETGGSNRLVIQSTRINIDIPAQTLLSKKYIMEIPKDLSNSCLYAVSDLFDNYVILGNEIWSLTANTSNQDYNNIKHAILNELLRVDNVSIYEIHDDTGRRFLVRFRPKLSGKVRKLDTVILYNSSHKVIMLDLGRLYGILSASQDSYDLKNRQYLDATNYLLEADAWPLVISKVRTGDWCGDNNNHIREYKIYFVRKQVFFICFYIQLDVMILMLLTVYVLPCININLIILKFNGTKF